MLPTDVLMLTIPSLDLEMPGITRFRSTEVLKAAIKKGEITPKTIDNRARAVLQLLERTGKFSDRREQLAEKAIDLPEHRKLIREAGAEGIVLLKNDNQTLPIDATKIKKIALLGPLAKYAAAHGGGSASLNSHYKISPFDAFTERLGKDVEISYSKGTYSTQYLAEVLEFQILCFQILGEECERVNVEPLVRTGVASILQNWEFFVYKLSTADSNSRSSYIPSLPRSRSWYHKCRWQSRFHRRILQEPRTFRGPILFSTISTWGIHHFDGSSS